MRIFPLTSSHTSWDPFGAVEDLSSQKGVPQGSRMGFQRDVRYGVVTFYSIAVFFSSEKRPSLVPGMN